MVPSVVLDDTTSYKMGGIIFYIGWYFLSYVEVPSVILDDTICYTGRYRLLYWVVPSTILNGTICYKMSGNICYSRWYILSYDEVPSVLGGIIYCIGRDHLYTGR